MVTNMEGEGKEKGRRREEEGKEKGRRREGEGKKKGRRRKGEGKEKGRRRDEECNVCILITNYRTMRGSVIYDIP